MVTRLGMCRSCCLTVFSLLLLFNLVAIEACKPLDNRFDELRHVCGENIDSTMTYVGLQGVDGENFDFRLTQAVRIDVMGREYSVPKSEKGCFGVSDTNDGTLIAWAEIPGENVRLVGEMVLGDNDRETKGLQYLHLKKTDIHVSIWRHCGEWDEGVSLPGDARIIRINAIKGMKSTDLIALRHRFSEEPANMERLLPSRRHCFAIPMNENISLLTIVYRERNHAVALTSADLESLTPGVVSNLELRPIQASDLIEHCGPIDVIPDADPRPNGNGIIVKFLSPSGTLLMGDDLPEVFLRHEHTGEMNPLRVSPLGCIALTALSDEESLIARKLGPGHVWSVSIPGSDFSNIRQQIISLLELDLPQVVFSCGETSLHTNGVLRLPVHVRDFTSSSDNFLVISGALLDGNGKVLQNWEKQQPGSLLKFDDSVVDDGEYRLELRASSLLDSTTSEQRATCMIQLDRTLPRVRLFNDHKWSVESGIPERAWIAKIRPDQPLFSELTDEASPVHLSYSLSDVTEGKHIETVRYTTDKNIAAPAKGDWVLRYSVADSAGNSTPEREILFHVFREELADQIEKMCNDVMLIPKCWFFMENQLTPTELRHFEPLLATHISNVQQSRIFFAGHSRRIDDVGDDPLSVDIKTIRFVSESHFCLNGRIGGDSTEMDCSDFDKERFSLQGEYELILLDQRQHLAALVRHGKLYTVNEQGKFFGPYAVDLCGMGSAEGLERFDSGDNGNTVLFKFSHRCTLLFDINNPDRPLFANGIDEWFLREVADVSLVPSDRRAVMLRVDDSDNTFLEIAEVPDGRQASSTDKLFVGWNNHFVKKTAYVEKIRVFDGVSLLVRRTSLQIQANSVALGDSSGDLLSAPQSVWQPAANSLLEAYYAIPPLVAPPFDIPLPSLDPSGTWLLWKEPFFDKLHSFSSIALKPIVIRTNTDLAIIVSVGFESPSPYSDSIILGLNDGRVARRSLYPLASLTGSVRHIGSSSDDFVAIGYDERSIARLDTKTIRPVEIPGWFPLTDLVFYNNRIISVLSNFRQNLLLWDFRSEQCIKLDFDASPIGIRISKNGRYLLIHDHDLNLGVYSVDESLFENNCQSRPSVDGLREIFRSKTRYEANWFPVEGRLFLIPFNSHISDDLSLCEFSFLDGTLIRCVNIDGEEADLRGFSSSISDDGRYLALNIDYTKKFRNVRVLLDRWHDNTQGLRKLVTMWDPGPFDILMDPGGKYVVLVDGESTRVASIMPDLSVTIVRSYRTFFSKNPLYKPKIIDTNLALIPGNRANRGQLIEFDSRSQILEQCAELHVSCK